LGHFLWRMLKSRSGSFDRGPQGYRSAGPELIGDGGFSTRVVLAQLRSTAIDMLPVGGLPRDDALAVLPALSRRKESTGTG
jgi:hypothetical protein